MIVAAFLSHICLKMQLIVPVNLSPDQSRHLSRVLFFFSILFVSNIALGNVSLDIVSIPFSQILRTFIPYVTMLTSALILGSRFSMKVILSVLPVSLGVSLTVYANIEFSWIASLVIGAGIVAASLKVTMTSMYLSHTCKNMHPVEFLARICPMSAIHLIVFATARGETGKFIHQLRTDGMETNVILLALLTGLAAFVLNWSNFEANRLTSPLTMCIAGNVKQVLTILLSMYLFNNHLQWWNGIGVVMALTGTAAYSILKLQENSPKPDAAVKKEL